MKLSHSDLNFLSREAQNWVQDRLISEETRTAILARYEVSSRTDSLRRTGLLTILSLGVFLLGLSIFLLVSFNWSAMRATEKLAIVFGSMAAAYVAGGVFAGRKHPILSEVAFFLGTILFGVGIWQVGQIFHVSAHAPDLLWYWAVGSLALAIGLRTPVVHVLVCALLLIWIPWEICDFSHLAPGFLRWTGTLWGVSLPNLGWSVPVLLAVGYWVTPWVEAGSRSRATIRFFYAITLLEWVLYIPSAWNIPFGTSFYYVISGSLLALVPRFVAQIRGEKTLSPTAWLLVTAGTLIFAAGLIPFSFKEIRHFSSNLKPDFYAVAAGLEVLFLLTLGLTAWKVAVREFMKRNWLLLLTGIYAAAVLFFPLLPLWRGESEKEIWPVVIAQNVLMFSLAIAYIHAGLRESRLPAFIFGVLYFLLWSIFRYIDLFGDAGGMLGASGLFFFCAVVMFGFAYYWVRRKSS